MDYHFLLQGIFPSHGSNLGLHHGMQIGYHLRHQRSTSFKHRCSNAWQMPSTVLGTATVHPVHREVKPLA